MYNRGQATEAGGVKRGRNARTGAEAAAEAAASQDQGRPPWHRGHAGLHRIHRTLSSIWPRHWVGSSIAVLGVT